MCSIILEGPREGFPRSLLGLGPTLGCSLMDGAKSFWKSQIPLALPSKCAQNLTTLYHVQLPPCGGPTYHHLFELLQLAPRWSPPFSSCPITLHCPQSRQSGSSKEKSHHVISLLRTWPISLSIEGPIWSAPSSFVSDMLVLIHPGPVAMTACCSPDMPSTFHSECSSPSQLQILHKCAPAEASPESTMESCTYHPTPALKYFFLFFQLSLQNLFLSNIPDILLIFSIQPLPLEFQLNERRAFYLSYSV